MKSLFIGKWSFSQYSTSQGADISKSFRILNCELLESIIIEGSFRDYAGPFELKNLPSLKTIDFGGKSSWSYSFYYNSLVIRGKDIALGILEWLDLPNLQLIRLREGAFCDSLHTVIESAEWIWMIWLI